MLHKSLTRSRACNVSTRIQSGSLKHTITKSWYFVNQTLIFLPQFMARRSRSRPREIDFIWTPIVLICQWKMEADLESIPSGQVGGRNEIVQWRGYGAYLSPTSLLGTLVYLRNAHSFPFSMSLFGGGKEKTKEESFFCIPRMQARSFLHPNDLVKGLRHRGIRDVLLHCKMEPIYKRMSGQSSKDLTTIRVHDVKPSLRFYVDPFLTVPPRFRAWRIQVRGATRNAQATGRGEVCQVLSNIQPNLIQKCANGVDV